MSDVLGRVIEGILRAYFSKRITLVRLEDPSGSSVAWFTPAASWAGAPGKGLVLQFHPDPV